MGLMLIMEDFVLMERFSILMGIDTKLLLIMSSTIILIPAIMRPIGFGQLGHGVY